MISSCFGVHIFWCWIFWKTYIIMLSAYTLSCSVFDILVEFMKSSTTEEARGNWAGPLYAKLTTRLLASKCTAQMMCCRLEPVLFTSIVTLHRTMAYDVT